MITILHGDDIVSSREELFKLKNAATDTVTFQGKTLTIEKLREVMTGRELFVEGQKLIIFENLLSSPQSQEFTSYITKEKSQSSLVIWEEKELTNAKLKIFKNAQIKLFKLKPVIFNFLDSILPSQGQLLVKMFHDILKTAQPEIVFYMLTRQFRLMLALSDSGSSPIDEVKRLAPWQRGKISRQASFFGKEQLVEVYKKLYKIETEYKTGQNTMPLATTLDLFLLNI